MSLIITSNQNEEDVNTQSEIYKPYSYTNHLNNNTLKIPPNSEIALQSCKINKSGLFTLSRLNNVFGLYFGKKLEGGTYELEDSTQSVMLGNIGDLFPDDFIETSVQDMAKQIQIGMRNTISHPAVIKGIDSDGNVDAGITCLPKFGADSSFNGYEWVLTQHTATEEGTTYLDVTDGVTNLTGPDDKSGISYTVANGVFTNNFRRDTQIRCDAFPITNLGFKGNNGSNVGNLKGIVFDINQALTDNANWIVGLVRPNLPSDRNDEGSPNEYLPAYFDKGNNMPSGEGKFKSNQFWDYCVRRVGTQLRIFQSAIRTSRTSGVPDNLVMQPIQYWGYGGNFDDEYNITENTENYRYIKFSISNEKVVIQISADNTNYIDLVNQDQITGPAKNNVCTPINCTQWHLFPSCFLNKASSITMTDFYKYTALTDTYDNKDEKLNWWVRICNAGISSTFGKDVESRPWNNYSNATVRDPLGADSHSVMDESQLVFTLAENSAYGNIVTRPCNTQFTFGFIGRSLVDTLNASTHTTQTINSDDVPKLISNVSLFIRLNNLPNFSTNAIRGTSTSKIIAHLPRFDNSGNETGGLYFEPTSERVYIKLNNPSEILLNQIDIDIVYANEQLCKAITGKTIIVLHIRDSK